ncbi:MAG TPA: AMP-binding protein [Solirubrobacteraceae bacterium]|nr:AMP-binding protein [Solirubrobacteraceae bacterium]
MRKLPPLLRKPAALGLRGAVEGHAVIHGFRSGMLGIDPPRKVASVLRALDHLGPIGGALAVAASRHGDQTGVIDERGSLTFKEIDGRTDALAYGLRARGVNEGETIGILCRNHRGFLDITFAAAKLGARALYLNTDFAGPQLRDVCAREGVSLLVHDEEYMELVTPIETKHRTLLGWTDGAPGADTLEAVIAENAGRSIPLPKRVPQVVLLTSGTTGTPKGAPRHSGATLSPMGAILSKVPFRARESTYVAAPMFHALGFTEMVVTVSLGSTVVVRRRFKPELVLADIAKHRCTGLIVVPVMLRRVVDLIESEPGSFDTSSLRIVLLSGSALEAELARRALRTLGDVIYNFYGSTEVAWATFATPEDLRAAPGTAGRAPFGTVVKLFDHDCAPVVGANHTGRIFVGNGFQFEGYTGGGNKDMIDGLMSTGDVGHFDEAGRLFIDGRDDDMIISGGENVFPGEIEELLITNEAIEEASVIGVEDPDWGWRLVAFVVLRPGRQLSDDEVRDFVKANLARYKVPREVHFLDELPRNPTGKVLKRELRARLAGVGG